jgi:hypothetical protein
MSMLMLSNNMAVMGPRGVHTELSSLCVCKYGCIGKDAIAGNWKIREIRLLHVKSMPYIYRHNSSAWITCALSMVLLTCSERGMIIKNWKILLFLDL